METKSKKLFKVILMTFSLLFSQSCFKEAKVEEEINSLTGDLHQRKNYLLDSIFMEVYGVSRESAIVSAFDYPLSYSEDAMKIHKLMEKRDKKYDSLTKVYLQKDFALKDFNAKIDSLEKILLKH